VYTDPPDHSSQLYTLGDYEENWGNDEDDPVGEGWYPQRYNWRDGNFSCDCNRSRFIGKDLRCGHQIYIDFIQPIEPIPGFSTLCLMESIQSVIEEERSREWHEDLERGLEGGFVREPVDPYWGLGTK
jgi:hypothetical protein